MNTKIKSLLNGASGDSFFLIFVRFVTLILGIVMTRILSQHFSIHDYGTYSQITLIVSTVTGVTILGMTDGINFFYCKEKDEEKRKSYASTIFSLQYLVSFVAAAFVLLLTVPLSNYFDNESLRSLMVFAAVLPVMQNTISLLQILFLAIGKAKLIALRNLMISLLKLLGIALACYVFDNIAVLLICQFCLDLLQIFYLGVILYKNHCRFSIFQLNSKLIKEILCYCIPMAMFVVLNSLNRDCDKYVIGAFTDTESLAIYTNASKVLPFDLIMSSFCTVLLPYITRLISERQYEKGQRLYRSFLEISYISTTVLAVGAMLTSSELMRFLYTEKYLTGISVFLIYIAVDIIRVLNITLILSAAGKTKYIMLVSMGALVTNLGLNILFYEWLGFKGPALATFVVTLCSGIILLSGSSKQLQSSILKMFDWKYLLLFVLELSVCSVVVYGLRWWLKQYISSYFILLIIVYGVFVCAMLILNYKRIFKDLKQINSYKLQS